MLEMLLLAVNFSVEVLIQSIKDHTAKKNVLMPLCNLNKWFPVEWVRVYLLIIHTY